MNFDEMISNVPENWTNNRLHFFKYMNEETAKIVLRNRTLSWSTAEYLNDPFELQLQVSLENIDEARVKLAALNKIWELYIGNEPIQAGNPIGIALEMLRVWCPGLTKEYIFEEMGSAIDESFEDIKTNSPKNRSDIMAELSSIKILSLTAAPNISLMWSHYANSHRGIVIRFRSIPAFDSAFGVARPVDYTDIRPSFFTETYLINSLSGLESVNTRNITESVIYTKMSEWSYEKEWRISSGAGRNKDAPFEDLPFGHNEIDGIVFGFRTSSEDRAELRRLAGAYPNIEFMEASPIQSAGKVAIKSA